MYICVSLVFNVLYRLLCSMQYFIFRGSAARSTAFISFWNNNVFFLYCGGDGAGCKWESSNQKAKCFPKVCLQKWSVLKLQDDIIKFLLIFMKSCIKWCTSRSDRPNHLFQAAEFLFCMITTGRKIVTHGSNKIMDKSGSRQETSKTWWLLPILINTY